MNYYIEGSPNKAEQIRAAFKREGYSDKGFTFDVDNILFFTADNKHINVCPANGWFANIIKTHPDYKKLELPAKLKFNVGDWIAYNENKSSIKPKRIVEIIGNKYIISSHESYDFLTLESDWHLWTIADAKDGDVLVDEDTNTIGVFEKTYGICWHSKIYCANSTYKKVYHRGGSHEIKFTKPATNEQRDLLFTRVREAGYEWDAEKKEFRKTIDESNFKVGDWVAGIDDEGDVATEKIVSFSHDKVLLLDTDGCHTEYPKTELSNFHLWTIADAKDGDVLVSGIDNPFIYDGDIEFSSAGAYVGVSRNGRIRLDMFPSRAWTSVKDVKPATNEQRDLLFAKLREAGCEWDADKKEVKKIQHYDIANFHAGMPVLVRDYDNSRWSYVQFSHYVGECRMKFNACGIPYIQCIPFNNDTKHLLGTADMCPEEYINW